MRHPARELYVKWCGVVWSAYYFGLVLVLHTGRAALLITENLPTLLMTNSGVKVGREQTIDFQSLSLAGNNYSDCVSGRPSS